MLQEGSTSRPSRPQQKSALLNFEKAIAEEKRALNQERCQKYRKSMTPEQKARYNETAKLRMRKLRESRKGNHVGNVEKKTRATKQRRDASGERQRELTTGNLLQIERRIT